MKKTDAPCLFRHANGTFYFRRAVPKDLVAAVGKTTWKQSLGTRDIRQGTVKGAECLRDTEVEISRLRQPTLQAAQLPSAETKIREFYQLRRRRNAIRVRPNPAEDLTLSLQDVGLRVVAAETRMARLNSLAVAAPDVLGILEAECTRLSEILGFEIDPEGTSGRTVALELWRSLLSEDREFLARARGDVVEQKAVRTATVRASTIADVLQSYRKEREARWSPKTLAKFETISKAIDGLIGFEKPVQEIDRATLRRVRDVIQDLPPNYGKRTSLRGLRLADAARRARELGMPRLNRKTVVDYVQHLSSIFGYAVKEEFIDRNPAAELAVATPEAETKRRPFTVRELNTLFAAPVYTGCVDDDTNWREPGAHKPRRGKFWVPLIALFTGMRLNEVACLKATDIKELEGTWVIEVSRSEGRRLKTRSSNRLIPVHDQLRRLGFIEWVAEKRGNKNSDLFPELPTSKLGYRSDPFSKWFRRFRDDAGVNGKDVTFHSFRHYFEDRLREAGVSQENQERIMGWDSPRQSSEYGDGPSASLLARDILRVSFPGVVMPFAASPPRTRRTAASRISA